MGQDRAKIQADLESMPGRQPVIMRKGPDHDFRDEWVHNEADIDHSRVVWARGMGCAQNQELIKYFKDRHAWLLEADQAPLSLSS